MFKRITRRMIFSLFVVFLLSFGLVGAFSGVATASIKINQIKDITLLADPNDIIVVDDADGEYGGTVTLSATLTNNEGGLEDKDIDFSINNTSVGTAVTDPSGNAILTVSLTGINASTYFDGIEAKYTLDHFDYGDLIVNKVTPIFSNLTSPTINFGTASVDLGGNIKLGSLIPTGSISITLSGVTQPATIIGTGDFSSSFNTASLAVTTYPITYEYTGDTNFNGISDNTKTLTVNNSNAMITLSNLSQTYDGQPKPVSYSTTPPGLMASITYNSSATAPTNAGSYEVNASITSPGYSGNANDTLIIAKATPTITWTNPAGIVYGTALSNTQLNASTSVTGSLAYSPSSGTILNAGNNQTLNVNLTPTDALNYNTASKSVIIDVLKANQTITFNTLANKSFGNADFTVSAAASSGLPVTFTASGACSVSDNLVHITGAGTATVIAHQTGNSNYNAAADITRSFTVAKATPVFSNLSSPTINYGTASINLGGNIKLGTLIPTGNLGITVAGETHGTSAPITIDASGDFSHSILTSSLALGIYPITYSYPGDNNFNGISDNTKELTVNNSNAMITLSNLSQTYDGQPKFADYTTTPLGLTVSITYNGSTTPPTNAGSYEVNASITSPGYSGNANDTLIIAKATPIITWTNPVDITYGTTLSNVQLNAAAGIPGSFIYSPASGAILNVGTNQTLNVNFTPTDTVNYNNDSKSVIINVNKAAPVFTNLSSPTIDQGTASAVLGGNIQSVNLIPTGSISIILNGVTLPAAINATTGDFSVSFDTSALVSSAAPYPITYSYNGDTNFNSISDNTFTLTVTPTGTPSPTPTTPPSSGGGGGGGGGGTAGNVIPSGFSNNTRLEVNSSGLILSAAKLTTVDGKATLDIPYRTKLLSELGNPLSILTVGEVSSPPDPPPSNALLSAYTFGPEGAKFDPPMNLILSYDPGTLPEEIQENSLFIAFWNGSQWILLESKVDTAAHTVSAPISHFSTYSLLGELASTAPTPAAPTSVPDNGLIPSPTIIPEILTSTTAAAPAIINIPEQTLTTNEPSPLASTQTPPFSTLIIIYVVVFIGVALLTVLFVSRLRGRA